MDVRREDPEEEEEVEGEIDFPPSTLPQVKQPSESSLSVIVARVLSKLAPVERRQTLPLGPRAGLSR